MEQENNFKDTRRKESVENETFVTGSEDINEDTVEQIKQSGGTDVGSKTDNSFKSEKHNLEQLQLDLLSQKPQEENKLADRLSCNISDFSTSECPESAPKTVVNDTTGTFDEQLSEQILLEDNEEMPLVSSSPKCFNDSTKIASFNKNSAADNYEKLLKENTSSNNQELISGKTNDTVKCEIKRNDAPLLHQLLQTTATLPYPTKCGLMCKQATTSCAEKTTETPINQITEHCENQSRSEDTGDAEMIIDEPMLTPLIASHMENELEDHEDHDMDSRSPVIELFEEEDVTNNQEKEHDCEDPNDFGETMDIDESENRKTDTKIKKVPNKDSKTDVECINFECERIGKKFIIAPNFALNLYKVTKKINKIQYVCEECYDKCIEKYQKLCQIMCEKKPLYVHQTPRRQEFVEILDSSDEEEENVVKDEEPPLTPETINMVEDDLNSIISNVLCRVDISAQLNWTTNILKDKINKFDELAEELCNEFSLLHKKANYMYNTLYQYPKIKIKELPPIDLNTGKPYSSDVDHNLPPWGELIYSRIEIGCVYFAARNKPIGSWLPCTVIEALGGGPDKQKPKSYKVKFKGKVSTIKSLPPKHMAYGEAPKIRLKIGSRVIALFDAATLNRFKDKSMQAIRNAFYPGVVAEELQAYNKYRYLIFFDDGYAQYVNHKDVRIVCESSENVWEDVHEGSREFIRTYLNQDHKNRPMVQVKKGQSMTTESNGKWLYAKVLDIDASLVLVYFSEENRCEWIYLGSCRLGPLYKERQKRLNFYQQSPQLARRTGPFVSYTQNYEAPKRPEQPPTYRAVARKSTARPESQNLRSTPVKHLNNSTIYLEDEKKTRGKIIFYTTKTNMPSKRYVAHECNPKCIFRMPHNVNSYSPLVKPMISGWERNLFSTKGKFTVVYRAPCGLRLRNMDEVHKYLRKTENPLNVDNFNFVEGMHCLAEYVIEDYTASKPDLSNGVENVPLQCLNYYDSTLPPECRYSTKRIPTKGVKLNLDPAFLAGCDCEDDCSDKSKCACWQLTLQGAKFGNPNTPPENVGYVYKRLLDQVPTGIYECNVNCKCSKSCLNRVAQWPLQLKLQVFKTSNRGWGLRCLTDVPKGTFICIYAGHLLTEQMANEGGLHSGDEYFAELDYIEVVERLKEGYESDVPDDVESDEDLDEAAGDNESDEEFRSSASFNRDASINTRLRAKRGVSTDDSKYNNENRTNKGSKSKKSSYYDDDGDMERKVINFEPNTSLDNEASNNSKYRSVRKYFGKNEYCYVMDAKKTGNLGRYFNHSCSPNLFVQNVFVDTHDLRFPWVAFFALKNIRAGTELTWNYNYEVGIVPGKVLYCECGAPNCRGRLL